LTGGQREVGIARHHQIEHARVQIVIGEVVLAAEDQGGHSVHAVDVDVPVVPAVALQLLAIEHRCNVDALRQRAALDAELETLAIGALQGHVFGQPRRERQVVAHLADDQRGSQVARVDLHVSVGFLLDDPYGHQLLQHRRRKVALLVQLVHFGTAAAAPLTAVDEGRWQRVHRRLVRPLRSTIGAAFDDDRYLFQQSNEFVN